MKYTKSTPLDPSSYQWEQHSPSAIWRRRTLASERMWISRPKELHEMFVSGALNLNSPLPNQALVAAATNAWRILRVEVPELVEKGKCNEDGKAFMQYQTPTGEEVEDWIHRTTAFEKGREALDFEGLREKILRLKKTAVSAETSSLLLYTELGSDEKSVDRIHVMLNVDHEVTDGIGARILFRKYLDLLAKCLEVPPGVFEDRIDWAVSARNLSSPWISIMNKEQVTSGPEYEEQVQMNKTMLFEKMSQNSGLPLLSTPATPSQQTHFITLSTFQTTNLLAALKSTKIRITPLTHAAVTLAFLRAISPPPPSPTFYSSCWLNGRRYLNSTDNYIPCCMSFFPIVFPDLQDFVLSKDASQEEVRTKLNKASAVAASEYEKLRNRKSVLPGIVTVLEEIGESMSKTQSLPQRPTTAAPLFLSDGKTEQYISHSYPTSSSTPVFSVEDVQFAANADTELILRMSSWRGRTTVSGEWNARDYERGFVVGVLEDVVGIMGSILDV